MIITKNALMVLVLFAVSGLLSACGPPRVDKWVDIQSTQSAFVIPMVGATDKQKQFASEDFLKQKKVGIKRVFLAQEQVNTGRFWWEYKWIATDVVVVVDRAPIHLVWTGKDGLQVESRDSINFSVGIDITAHIEEEDASNFLYHYSTGNLKEAISGAVKSKANEELSLRFGALSLDAQKAVYDNKGNIISPPSKGARDSKAEIVKETKESLVKYFKERGISIDAFGLAGGLTYKDVAIQAAINRNFETELDVENKRNEKVGQDEVNAKNVGMAEAEKQAAQKFAEAKEARTSQVRLEIEKINAQANLERAHKWSGNLPANMMPEGSNFLYQMDTKK